MKSFKTVEAYIGSYPKGVQAPLKKLRLTIRKAAPKAVEAISYGMVGYKSDGRPLVYFGGFKKHVGFFSMPSGNAAFKKELSKYQTAKSAVRFPLDEPIPVGLVTKIVKFRLKENRQRA